MKKFLSTVIAILLFNSNSFAEWSIWYAPDKADFFIDKLSLHPGHVINGKDIPESVFYDIISFI